MANITEDQVKSALDDFVSEQCCYGKKPLRLIEIREIMMNSAFHVNHFKNIVFR